MQLSKNQTTAELQQTLSRTPCLDQLCSPIFYLNALHQRRRVVSNERVFFKSAVWEMKCIRQGAAPNNDLTRSEVEQALVNVRPADAEDSFILC